MSRSYRRPYAAITGVQSANRDKQQASRSVRRRINQWLHIQYATGGEFELVPHRLECQHNDVWCWDRDGKQRLQVPDARDWSCHFLEVNGLTLSRTENGEMKSGSRAGTSGCGGSKRGVGVLGVLTQQIGSMPVRSTKFSNGTLAHMGERPPCKRERSVQLR